MNSKRLRMAGPTGPDRLASYAASTAFHNRTWRGQNDMAAAQFDNFKDCLYENRIY